MRLLLPVILLAFGGCAGAPDRRQAIFSMGQLGVAQEGAALPAWEPSARALKAALDDPDWRLRQTVIEALGKTGGDGVEELLTGVLRDPQAPLRGEAALALFRLKFLKRMPQYSSAAVAGLSDALSDGDAGVRWKAAYAFSRAPEPRAAERLRAAAGDKDALVRLFAIRALGQFKKEAPEAALLGALKDMDPQVRREAVAALGSAGKAVLLPDAVFSDPAAPVRAAAADAVGASGDASLAGRLSGLLQESSTLVRGQALLASAKVMGEAAGPLLHKERTYPHWWIRARAYEALGSLLPGSQAFLQEGVLDGDPRVASTALEALARSTDTWADQALLRVLLDTGTALEVVGTAVDAAKERPKPEFLEALGVALSNPAVSSSAEVVGSLIEAAAAILKARPELSAPWLEPLKAAPPRLPFAQAPSSPLPASTVILETEKGTIVLSLAVAEAPIHAARFLKSVQDGFYDGTIWHRVVADFVIQGGDPRGSGWGDAGFLLRDEINTLRFDRGALGMPKAGKDTGGCQLFITHVPTPHLDGRYTVFGRVESGMDAVDRIEPGDKILRARLR
ncbi:MAG: peptidylprolyl isomerase [Elusimicrobiota bacterium]